MSTLPRCLRRCALALVSGALLLAGHAASAQVTPAAGHTPPDDTPKIGVGVTIYADYTYTDERQITDSDRNNVSKSEFDVRRADINVTGYLNHFGAGPLAVRACLTVFEIGVVLTV